MVSRFAVRLIVQQADKAIAAARGLQPLDRLHRLLQDRHGPSVRARHPRPPGRRGRSRPGAVHPARPRQRPVAAQRARHSRRPFARKRPATRTISATLHRNRSGGATAATTRRRARALRLRQRRASGSALQSVSGHEPYSAHLPRTGEQQQRRREQQQRAADFKACKERMKIWGMTSLVT